MVKIFTNGMATTLRVEGTFGCLKHRATKIISFVEPISVLEDLSDSAQSNHSFSTSCCVRGFFTERIDELCKNVLASMRRHCTVYARDFVQRKIWALME